MKVDTVCLMIWNGKPALGVIDNYNDERIFCTSFKKLENLWKIFDMPEIDFIIEKVREQIDRAEKILNPEIRIEKNNFSFRKILQFLETRQEKRRKHHFFL